MKRYRPKYRPNTTTNRYLAARRIENQGRNRLLISLGIFLVLGYFSLTWLLPTLIGGLSVLNRFKATPPAPTPVANNVTLAPPVLNIPFESTNTATINVRGYSLPNTKVEIYLDNELMTSTTSLDDGSFLAKVDLNLGTNGITGKTVDEQNKESLPSKVIHILYQNEKPELDISEPQDNFTIQGGDKKVTVSGSVSPSEGITVTANSSRLIVRSDGKFSQTIGINEGENNIIIEATDQAGNSAQVTRKVTYQP